MSYVDPTDTSTVPFYYFDLTDGSTWKRNTRQQKVFLIETIILFQD